MSTASSPTQRHPLLLVEDDPRLGPLVRDVLAMTWDVDLAVDLARARELVSSRLYSVAVVDRRLPDGDGAELVAWMRQRADATPVLMLTALGQVADKVEGLDAGANDYLVKPFDFEELEARLRALTRDYTGRGEGVPIGSWTLFPRSATIESPYSGRIVLTRAEADLLAVLTEHPDAALTRAQLLAAVFDHGESAGTVDTYVHYIRRKTEPDLIQTVRGVGYRLGTPA